MNVDHITGRWFAILILGWMIVTLLSATVKKYRPAVVGIALFVLMVLVLIVLKTNNLGPYDE